MSITAISNGLDTDPFDSVNLGDVIPTVVDVEGIVNRNTEAAQSLDALMAKLETEVAEFKEKSLAEARSHYNGLRKNVPGVGTVGPDAEAINSVMRAEESRVEQRTRHHAQSLIIIHQKQIDDIKQRLHTAGQHLGNFLKVHPSPVSLLSVQSLSDPRRATLAANIAHAGPQELLGLAKLAIASQDRALAAAVLARNDEMPTANRSFSSQTLAKKVVGQEHEAFVKAHDRMTSLYQSAYNRVNALGSGKGPTSLDKIKKGLREAQTNPSN